MKKTRLIALLAACVMLLTSCGGAQGGSEGKQEGSTSAEAPKTEQSTERRQRKPTAVQRITEDGPLRWLPLIHICTPTLRPL